MSFVSSQRTDIRSLQISQDVLRRKRESEAVSLRKQAREEHMQKRRIESSKNESIHYKEIMKRIHDCKILLASQDEACMLEAVTGFQKLLSSEENPPIEEIIRCDVVGKFLEFLSHKNEDIQYMSLWAITNIAAGKHEHTQYLYERNAIPLIIQVLLSSNSHRIQEQGCWALGNISGDCPKFRDEVIKKGALKIVLRLLSSEEYSSNMVRTATWTLSNLCRGRPPPPKEIQEAIPVASRLIYSSDPDVEVDALWALAFLSESLQENQQSMAEIGICKRLVLLLQSEELRYLIPTLRIIGNLMSGDDKTTQLVIDNGVLPVLTPLLSHTKIGVRKESCWTISNVLAGPPQQISAVLNAGIFHIILVRLHEDREDIQHEAAWALANAVSGSTPELVVEFVESYGVIPHIVSLLSKCNEERLIDSLLDAVDRILLVGKKRAISSPRGVNVYLQMFDQYNAQEYIIELQAHNCRYIYIKAKKIIQDYWGSDENSIAIDEDTSNQQDYQWDQNPS
ncbi:uncharacterized protein LOC126327182 [Schistocerca gregaria]|uniref:uncharacterized protein LOC126327182 n=1 Tax=Schistocerca gregaria TaxID=7010 RepID=UPI00211E604E|nr:uncharacterized protein LOC126327182 [Schistocerca gregaria]